MEGVGRLFNRGAFSSRIRVKREKAGRYGYSRSVMMTAGCQNELQFRGYGLTCHAHRAWLSPRSPKYMGFVVVLLNRRRLVGWCTFGDGLIF